MARSVWTGSVSFGLVNIPVTLHPATSAHRVGFHEFQKNTGKRIHYRRVTDTSTDEVSWDDIEKGFEVAKGRYVMLTDEELEAAEPQKTRTIDIEQFVALDEIDPVNWDQTYYVGASGDAAAKAYALLRDAMTENKRVAIGRFVMRTKEYVVCLRPFEKILALQTMFFPDEVRSPKDVGIVPSRVAVAPRELAMARQLIDSLTAKWTPAQYRDTFRERVLELVHKKDKGDGIAPVERHDEPGQVLDLMAALKATLEGTRVRKPAPSAARGRDVPARKRAKSPVARAGASSGARSGRRRQRASGRN